MKKIVVFASGRGSNFQAILDGCKSGLIDANVVALFTNNADCGAVGKAKMANVPVINIDPTDEAEIVVHLMTCQPDLIVLAGYLKMIPPLVIESYEKIINIHPSLLPKYGGKGMYGLAVHRKVIANGDLKTGITIHMVNQEYDEGDIINQLCINVKDGDTPESLAAHVNKYEQILLVHTIKWIIENG